MPSAGDRPSPPPPEGRGRELGIRIEDALILASALALGAYAFREPLGLAGWPSAALLGTTLAVMAAVAVLRIRRLVRRRGDGTGAARGARKDGGHAD
jgi:hypothetical protein